jgi:hypothetical protein
VNDVRSYRPTLNSLNNNGGGWNFWKTYINHTKSDRPMISIGTPWSVWLQTELHEKP